VLECFEIRAGGLRIDCLGWLPLLCVSFDVPTGSGAVISIDGFALGTICEMWGSVQGFPWKKI
jgi:hypothetical protein